MNHRQIMDDAKAHGFLKSLYKTLHSRWLQATEDSPSILAFDDKIAVNLAGIPG